MDVTKTCGCYQTDYKDRGLFEKKTANQFSPSTISVFPRENGVFEKGNNPCHKPRTLMGEIPGT